MGSELRRAVLSLFYEWHASSGRQRDQAMGSERDLFYHGRLTLGSVREWLSGVQILNAFRMTPERMRATSRRSTPTAQAAEGLLLQLFELAQFAEENALTVLPPRLSFPALGRYTLSCAEMEAVYGCPVYNTMAPVRCTTWPWSALRDGLAHLCLYAPDRGLDENNQLALRG